MGLGNVRPLFLAKAVIVVARYGGVWNSWGLGGKCVFGNMERVSRYDLAQATGREGYGQNWNAHGLSHSQGVDVFWAHSILKMENVAEV